MTVIDRQDIWDLRDRADDLAAMLKHAERTNPAAGNVLKAELRSAAKLARVIEFALMKLVDDEPRQPAGTAVRPSPVYGAGAPTP